jgi:hypothetical protein
MKISPATETLNYLKETRAIINQSINLSGQRNKTLKIIAAIGTFKLLLMRIEAAITGTISGMGDDLTVGSIIIQKSIYDPILDHKYSFE